MFYCNAEQIKVCEFNQIVEFDEAIEFAADFEELPRRWLNIYGGLMPITNNPTPEAKRVMREYKRVYERLLRKTKQKEKSCLL